MGREAKVSSGRRRKRRDVARSRPHTRIRSGNAAIALVVALCAILWAAPQALAAAPTLDTSFDGGPDHTLANNGRLAADEATGDVYVIDIDNNVVDRFSSTGAFIGALRGTATANGSFNFGGDDDVAVDNSGGATQGRVYVVSENASLATRASVFAFDPSGNLLWEAAPTGFADTCGVAVDSAGRLWASDFTGGVQQLSTTDGSAVGSPVVVTGNTCHIAFDNADNLLMNHWVGPVDKYDAPAYTTSREIDSTPTLDVAGDSSNGDVYGNPGNEIHVFDSSGSVVSGTPFDTTRVLSGVAVAGALGKIYVSDRGNHLVQVFSRVGGAAPKPTARTGSASVTSLTAATVSGRANPNGAATTCTVEYGTTTAFGSTAPCDAAAGSGTSEADVSAGLTGLTAHTTYFYRLVTTSANGTTHGAVLSLTTDIPPTASTVVVTSITQTGATLRGTVNPNGINVTECRFEYSTDRSFGLSVPCSSLPGSGSSPVDVSADVTGLSASTTYNVRLVARSSAGLTNGGDASFATLPNAPAVTTGDATSLTQTGATLGGTVNAQGATTTCVIEYGTTTSYGSSAPCSPTPSGGSAVAVSAAVTGLAPGTTYHFRVTARNDGGTTSGADKTFTTSSPPPPADATLKLLGSKTLTVTGGRVALKLSCTGAAGATCSGRVTLTTKTKQRGKTKTITIGSATVSLRAGGTKTVSVKLSAAGKRLLAKSKHHKLKATLAGPSRLSASLTLKAQAVKRAHKKHKK